MSKKNIKRVSLILLAAALMAISLFGCGAAPEPSDPPEISNAPEQQSEQQSEESSAADISIGTFTTEDLDGNAVTESIFAEKDYTMVNVWGTFCGPCINEMPDLEKIHQSLPENIQMIGVVCDLPYGEDAEEILASAKDIVNMTGVTYPSLRLWDTADWFYSTSNVVPTTYFFDSEGKLVGDIIYGADLRAYNDMIALLGN